MLERLVDQGVRIAIDDFGVGYSSLGQLKTLPARVLKIDRSFVSSMESDQSDAAIVSSTIELSHRLGLEVIAEGVETPAHLARLRAAGCDIGQGHLLGRPLPGDQIPSVAHAVRSDWVSGRGGGRRSPSSHRLTASLWHAAWVPEGDSLHRAARRLQVLVGERIEAESPNPRGHATGVARADRRPQARLGRGRREAPAPALRGFGSSFEATSA